MNYLYSGLHGKHFDQIYWDADSDLSFWSGQARKYGDPVLELACGTGRVANTLALEGFRVTGLIIPTPCFLRPEGNRHPKVSTWNGSRPTYDTSS